MNSQRGVQVPIAVRRPVVAQVAGPVARPSSLSIGKQSAFRPMQRPAVVKAKQKPAAKPKDRVPIATIDDKWGITKRGGLLQRKKRGSGWKPVPVKMMPEDVHMHLRRMLDEHKEEQTFERQLVRATERAEREHLKKQADRDVQQEVEARLAEEAERRRLHTEDVRRDLEKEVREQRARQIGRGKDKEADRVLVAIMRGWRNRVVKANAEKIAVQNWPRYTQGMKRRAADGGHYVGTRSLPLPAEGGVETHVREQSVGGVRYLRRADGVYFSKRPGDRAWVEHQDRNEVPPKAREKLTRDELVGSVLPGLRYAVFKVVWDRIFEKALKDLDEADFQPPMVPVPQQGFDPDMTEEERVVWRILRWLAVGRDNAEKRPLVLDYMKQHSIDSVRPWQPCPRWKAKHWPRLRAVIDTPYLFPTERSFLTGSEKELTDLAYAKAYEVDWERLKAELTDPATVVDVRNHIVPFVTYMLLVAPVADRVTLSFRLPPTESRVFRSIASTSAKLYYKIFYGVIRYGMENMNLAALRAWHEQHRANYSQDTWGWDDPKTDIVEAAMHTYPVVREYMTVNKRARKQVRKRLRKQRGDDGDDVGEAEEREDSVIDREGRLQIGFDVFARREPVKRRADRRKKKPRQVPQEPQQPSFEVVEQAHADIERRVPRAQSEVLAPVVQGSLEVAPLQDAAGLSADLPPGFGAAPVQDDNLESVEEQRAAVAENVEDREKVERNEGDAPLPSEDELDVHLEDDDDDDDDDDDSGNLEYLYDGREETWESRGITPSSAQRRLMIEYAEAEPPPAKLLYHDVGTGKTLSSTIMAAAAAAGPAGIRRVIVMCPREVRNEFAATIAGAKRLYPFYNTPDGMTRFRLAQGGIERHVYKKGSSNGPTRIEITLVEDVDDNTGVDPMQVKVMIATYGQWSVGTASASEKSKRVWMTRELRDGTPTMLIIDEVHMLRNWLVRYHDDVARKRKTLKQQTAAFRALVNCMLFIRPKLVVGMSGTVAYDNAYNVPSVMAWMQIAATVRLGDDATFGSDLSLELESGAPNVRRGKNLHDTYKTAFMQTITQSPTVLDMLKRDLLDPQSWQESYFERCGPANSCGRFASGGLRAAKSVAKTLLVRPRLCPKSARFNDLAVFFNRLRAVDWQPRTDEAVQHGGGVRRIFPKERVVYVITPMTPEQSDHYRQKASKVRIELDMDDEQARGAEQLSRQDKEARKSLTSDRQGMNVFRGFSMKARAIVVRLSQDDPVKAEVPAIVYSNFIGKGVRLVARLLMRMRAKSKWRPLILNDEQIQLLRDNRSGDSGVLDSSREFADHRQSGHYYYAFFTDSQQRVTGLSPDQAREFAQHEAQMKKQKADILRLYNHPDNINGRYIRVFMITPKAGTGVDFKRTRSVHIMEGSYNDSALVQVRGRGARRESHAGYAREEDKVVTHRVYVSVHLRRDENEEAADVPPSVDERLLRLSRVKMHEVCAANAMLMTASPACTAAAKEFSFTKLMQCRAGRQQDQQTAAVLQKVACDYCAPMQIQYQRAHGALAWTRQDIANALRRRAVPTADWRPTLEEVDEEAVDTAVKRVETGLGDDTDDEEEEEEDIADDDLEAAYAEEDSDFEDN